MRRFPLLARERERVGAGGRAAGVRDVDVDRPERRLDVGDHARHGIEIGGVEHDPVPADPVGGFAHAVGIARGDRHARALGGEPGRDPEADSLRAAGDERHLALESEVHRAE